MRFGYNKWGAEKTWSELVQRQFDSKLEAERAEQLFFLQKAGEITNLQFQVPFILSVKPKVTITIDYSYILDGQLVYEDAKGVMMPDFRVKLAWLWAMHGVHVRLYPIREKKKGGGK